MLSVRGQRAEHCAGADDSRVGKGTASRPPCIIDLSSDPFLETLNLKPEQRSCGVKSVDPHCVVCAIACEGIGQLGAILESVAAVEGEGVDVALQGAPTRVRMVSQEHTIGERRFINSHCATSGRCCRRRCVTKRAGT